MKDCFLKGDINLFDLMGFSFHIPPALLSLNWDSFLFFILRQSYALFSFLYPEANLRIACFSLCWGNPTHCLLFFMLRQSHALLAFLYAEAIPRIACFSLCWGNPTHCLLFFILRQSHALLAFLYPEAIPRSWQDARMQFLSLVIYSLVKKLIK